MDIPLPLHAITIVLSIITLVFWVINWGVRSYEARIFLVILLLALIGLNFLNHNYSACILWVFLLVVHILGSRR